MSDGVIRFGGLGRFGDEWATHDWFGDAHREDRNDAKRVQQVNDEVLGKPF